MLLVRFNRFPSRFGYRINYFLFGRAISQLYRVAPRFPRLYSTRSSLLITQQLITTSLAPVCTAENRTMNVSMQYMCECFMLDDSVCLSYLCMYVFPCYIHAEPRKLYIYTRFCPINMEDLSVYNFNSFT